MQRPPPPDPRILAVFATVTYAAAVIAAWGFTSLLLDIDPIHQEDAGPLLGPAMIVTALAVTFIALLGARSGGPAVRALVAAASVYALMLAVGAVGYTLIRADLVWLVLFVGAYALSPFILSAAVLSGLAVLAVALTPGRPA